MIQRKQTLFLLELVFLSVSLMFVPSADVIRNDLSTNIFLIPILNTELISTLYHSIAIALNFAALIISFAVIFLYKNRALQVRLSYVILFIWLTLLGIILFCPLVEKDLAIQGIVRNHFTSAIALLAVISAWLTIRFIKKDIALLKSADRIR